MNTPYKHDDLNDFCEIGEYEDCPVCGHIIYECLCFEEENDWPDYERHLDDQDFSVEWLDAMEIIDQENN
jgi:hypothetical protein